MSTEFGQTSGTTPRSMDLRRVSETTQRAVEEVGRFIVGKDDVLRQILMGLLADGHILLQDFPGLAKTMIAQSFAQVLDIHFTRIQFTPDLLPGEITGGYIYNQRDAAFEFRKGPVFANLLLADEINRAHAQGPSRPYWRPCRSVRSPSKASASHWRMPFVVIATQNPVEFEGTYPLPEAQLDRFIMRTSIGYPSADDEYEILRRRQERKEDTVDLTPVVSHEELLAMQLALEDVHVSEPIGKYIVDLTRATREDSKVQVGASPRGVYALFKLARGARGPGQPRLRDPGGRQGRGGGRPRSPHRDEAGVLGPRHLRRVDRHRRDERGAHTASRSVTGAGA